MHGLGQATVGQCDRVGVARSHLAEALGVGECCGGKSFIHPISLTYGASVVRSGWVLPRCGER